MMAVLARPVSTLNSASTTNVPLSVTYNLSVYPPHRPLGMDVVGFDVGGDEDIYNAYNNVGNGGDNGSVGTTSSLGIPSEERYVMESLFVTIILGAIVILTITGNFLVIMSVILNGNLHTTTNYFIANLAVADLLLGTTVLPFSATLEVLQYWVFGQIFCNIWAAIDVLCCTASILSLCVISIDRYIGVTRPLQHARIMRHARAAYIILFVWVLSLTISVAPLIGWKEAPDPDPRICTVTTHPGYVLFSVAGSFYIPCLIILVVYFRIYRETVKYTRCLKAGAKTAKVDEENIISLRIHTGRSSDYKARSHSFQNKSSPRTSRESKDSAGNEHGNRRFSRLFNQDDKSDKKRNSRMTFSSKVAKFKREKKAAKTLGIVVGVFITCWLPFFAVLPLDSLCSNCVIPPLMFKLTFWLGYCNSTMNPIIYTCFSHEFRRAFLAILCCRRCRRRPKVSLTEMQLRGKPRHHRNHTGRKSHSSIKSRFKSPFSNGKATSQGNEGQEDMSTQGHSSSINNSYGNGDSSSFGSDCKYNCNSCIDLSYPALSQSLSKPDNDYLNENGVQRQMMMYPNSNSLPRQITSKQNKTDTIILNGFPEDRTPSLCDVISLSDFTGTSPSGNSMGTKSTSGREQRDCLLCSSVNSNGLVEIITSPNGRMEHDFDNLKGEGSDRFSSYSLTETISCSE